MKNKYGKLVALMCMMLGLCSLTGCSGGESIEQEISQKEDVENRFTEDKIVDYGDRVTISCEITKQPIVWEDAGEAEFQVATTSVQFQNEFDLSEETTMKKVKEAIGKTVGESFTLWFEGGDGLYGYEYTIQEVVGKPVDEVTYGDKVHTTYSMKAIGVDRGDDITTGEQVIHVVETDKFLASEEIGYSVSAGERRVKDIVGKGVGDTFRIKQETPEWSESYLHTILQIDKAVEYGDTIRTTMRRASVLADNREVVASDENVSMELLAPKGMISLLGNDLNMADTMRFLREMEGKSIGDRVYFSTISDSERRFYNISILDVSPGEVEEGDYEIEALMMSEEENSLYFYDDNKDFPIYYAIVADEGSNLMCEYMRGDEGDYWLETSYSYEPEYDQQDRLVRETYSGAVEKICEYTYNEQGVCVELKKSFPDSDIVYVDYYDDAGLLIGSEELYGDGRKYVIEYAEGGSICVRKTYYDADGNVTTDEYDEWGFLIVPTHNLPSLIILNIPYFS